MNKFLAFLGAAAVGFAAMAEEPIITLTTAIYESYGASNHFTLLLGSTEETYIDVDCGYGEVEYEVKPATWDSENYSISGTPIDVTVSSAGTVKIYGDGSKINYIYAEGANIRTIDFTACPNMEIVDLPHNELQALDLSSFSKLAAVYLSDNPFTAASPLKIGTNHPDLQILEVDIVDYMDSSFDITTFPKLKSFDGYANKSLTHLDPTQCPELLRISIDSTPVTSLDVTQNPNLMILNIEDTGITSIDVSHNTYLRELYANHTSAWVNPGVKISSIDVTNNPNLINLTVAGNALTSLDISKNPLLIYCNASHNYLTELNADNNLQLFEFNISDNNMGFATMPMPQTWYGNYVYNQRPIALERSYKEGTTLDFSSKVMREDTETTAQLYTYNAATATSTLVDEADYTFANGKITFNKSYTDSVYVRFANDVFLDYPMTTSKFMVKSEADFGQPSKILTFNAAGSVGDAIPMIVGLDGATPENPKTFYIDWGNGQMVPCESTGATVANYTKGASGLAAIYIPEDEVLTDFGVDGVTLYSVNLSAATELRTLSLTNTGLYAIDLEMNRCLTSLNLKGNNLYNLNLSGANGEYNKNVLHDINLANNNISNLTLNDSRAIHNLDLSNNQLESFVFTNFDNIRTFSIANNKIPEANLSYMSLATSIDLSGNQLTTVAMPEEISLLTTFNLANNLFTLETLPELPSVANYTYAPQAMIEIPTKGPGVDLSAQNRNGATVYTWYKQDGTPLPAADYNCNAGVTSFINTKAGKIYCAMTNPGFPGFAGANALRTSVIEAAGMPTNCIAEFVTAVDGQTVNLSLAAAEASGTALYIDWNGQGTDLSQYILGDTYRLFTATTKANAHVKVYTYSTDEHITVFSMTGASLRSMDASKLTSAYNFTVVNGGLESVTLPQTATLRELNLEGNALTEADFSLYPNLYMLTITNNQLTSLDLGGYSNLALLAAARNQISDITFVGNDKLWRLDLSGNELKNIDVSDLPALEELSLNDNKLRQLDVTANNKLRVLQLSGNYFTFATLPEVKSNYYYYIYSNQQPVEVECVNGQVDLSDQAVVGEYDTTYRWFLGIPEFDENGDLVGEELYIDDEYTLADGVTTFHTTLSGVMCVMTNEAFPKLYLYTPLINVEDAGIAPVVADFDSNLPVEIYNLQGVKVNAHNLTPGIYIYRQGDRAAKRIVR